jgi:hypothetical protein
VLKTNTNGRFIVKAILNTVFVSEIQPASVLMLSQQVYAILMVNVSPVTNVYVNKDGLDKTVNSLSAIVYLQIAYKFVPDMVHVLLQITAVALLLTLAMNVVILPVLVNINQIHLYARTMVHVLVSMYVIVVPDMLVQIVP